MRNFRIVAVIESQVEKWFEDARVTTAVTILQREVDHGKRYDNLVRFIQLRKPLAEVYSAALERPLRDGNEVTHHADMDAIRDLIEEIDANQSTDYWQSSGTDPKRALGRWVSPYAQETTRTQMLLRV